MAKNTADSGGIGKALKKYLITGILVWLPIAVTLWVITYIVSASDQLINLLPEHWQPMHLIGFNIPGLGVIVAVLVLFVTGLFGANVLGRRIIAAWDALLGRNWPRSVSVGFSKATTRAPRGLRCSIKRLMVPPLPAASRPSKMHTMR